ncbi:Transposase [Frankia torreyi]|uniref:Transposase n=1 Tax=Frankia torreyi TaxID=1856 RepID=A0A0D8B5S4_9ACTN|nr:MULTISPECIES: transposase [Frankia]KJE19541.1 Transposase [Frankia torreyi]KQM05835.1 Transposase [Frankia sp. CpI1-P]
MSRPTRYPPRFRAHAVAAVALARARHPSEWAAIQAVAANLTISAETLRTWVRQATSPDSAPDPADASRHQAEIRRLNRENARLRHALDLLRDAERSTPRRGSVTISPAGTPTAAPIAAAPPERRTPSTVRRRSGQDASR